jgi:phosphoserine phosphatase RsbU/P
MASGAPGLAVWKQCEMDNRRVLVAEDDPTCSRILEVSLGKWGYAPVSYASGRDAWEALQQPDAPSLAILDWMMPGMDGVEICQRARQRAEIKGMYIILLTTRSSKEDVVEGLWSGADDYVVKPFNIQEMRARVLVGTRVLTLQRTLADRVAELERAASNIKQLQGLLPMCAYCKSIRNDQNYWERVEQYISEHSGAQFTHGICPSCYEKVMADLQAERGKSRAG